MRVDLELRCVAGLAKTTNWSSLTYALEMADAMQMANMYNLMYFL